MRGKRYSVAVALLLCAVNTLCFDDVENRQCVTSWETECFQPDYNLSTSDPVSLKSSAGKKLLVLGLPDSACQWGRNEGPLMNLTGTVSLVIPQLSKTHSGLYTLSCKCLGGSNFSRTVDLRVLQLPSKPRLLLVNTGNPNISPSFVCISEGSPRPNIEIKSRLPDLVVKKPTYDKWTAESQVSTTEYIDSGLMCCATNVEGKECTPLCDLDLNTPLVTPDEVSVVTVGLGEPFLLRCRIKGNFTIEWEHDGKKLEIKSTHQDAYMGHHFVYTFIRSASFEHNGTYTCKSSTGKAKSIAVLVTAETFVSSQLPDQFLITQKGSCLATKVSFHPALQLCYWEAPDGNLTKCIRKPMITNYSTVEYCEPLQSGVYKLHLKAGNKTETKNTNVCVVESPKTSFRPQYTGLVVETLSVLPANSTWSYLSSNESSETDSSWKVIKTGYHPASEGFCNKILISSMNKDLTHATKLRFCLTSQVGLRCDEPLLSNLHPQASRVDPPSDAGLLMPMKIGVAALLLALAVVTVALVYYVKKKKPQYQPQLQMIQMVGGSDNDYIYINFKDFAYDNKWEFPRENLELGKELGSGAFGMVVQATAYGIDKPGVSQQVAVKMLKEKHQSVEKEALMSELKMLTHIGQHANIVNLLGACTEIGPIYLIFQYCCYGDLLNYLRKSGDRYHKSVNDAFCKDRFSSLYNNIQPRKNSSEVITTADNYMLMHGSTSRGQEDLALVTFSSNDMEDPDMYCSEDDHMEQQALTFNDLLSFAFQVAKGMEFLSAKNCIHRDLAARNVLVTKGRLVKIGDFGLARDIDNDSNYVVRGNVRLPVKWMAPESIFQGMYTMKSDVWAYGILLWEIFSLGVTPYPGIKVDHMFYSMIERGFKMECPYYANDSVYGIICKCWSLDPQNRPSFSNIVNFMNDQLMDVEEKLYHNMVEQDFSDYQNASTVVDISALEKERGSETAAGNEYCKSNLREESKAEALKSEPAVEEVVELLKPSDVE